MFDTLLENPAQDAVLLFLVLAYIVAMILPAAIHRRARRKAARVPVPQRVDDAP